VLVGAVRYAVPSLSRTLRHWLKGRQQSAQLRADIEVAELQTGADVERSKIIHDERIELARMRVEAHREERTEERLWERLERVERETRACEDGRAADRRAHEEQRRHDREECDRRVAAVEHRTSRLAVRVAERWRLDSPVDDEDEDERDDTGLHEVDAIARSTPLPPKEER
jgi:hypothetical protein